MNLQTAKIDAAKRPAVIPPGENRHLDGITVTPQGEMRRHKRVIVTHCGGPDALRVIEEERPEPKEREVRVRVLAAGVSLPDVMARAGVHPETPLVPFTQG